MELYHIHLNISNIHIQIIFILSYIFSFPATLKLHLKQPCFCMYHLTEIIFFTKRFFSETFFRNSCLKKVLVLTT